VSGQGECGPRGAIGKQPTVVRFGVAHFERTGGPGPTWAGSRRDNRTPPPTPAGYGSKNRGLPALPAQAGHRRKQQQQAQGDGVTWPPHCDYALLAAISSQRPEGWATSFGALVEILDVPSGVHRHLCRVRRVLPETQQCVPHQHLHRLRGEGEGGEGHLHPVCPSDRQGLGHGVGWHRAGSLRLGGRGAGEGGRGGREGRGRREGGGGKCVHVHVAAQARLIVYAYVHAAARASAAAGASERPRLCCAVTRGTLTKHSVHHTHKLMRGRVGQ
jgi:hypothetical protein